MKFILGCGILLALSITASTALECYKCNNFDFTQTEEYRKQCEDGSTSGKETCKAVDEQCAKLFVTDGTNNVYVRGCAKPLTDEECWKSAPGLITATDVKCSFCNSNLCNSGLKTNVMSAVSLLSVILCVKYLSK